MVYVNKNIKSIKKIRRITPSHSNDRGILPTNKNLNDGFVEFESLTEEALFLLLDHDPNCINIESQPLKITNNTDKKKKYFPDAWATFKDGEQYIFDVKHDSFFNLLENNPEKAIDWNERKKCIQDFCKENGLNYLIVTNNEIFNKRLENVRFVRKNKRKPNFYIQIKPYLDKILTEKVQLQRIELAIEIGKVLNLDIKEIIPVIDHLIYYDYFLLDFELEINDNTILKLRFDKESRITALYSYLKNNKIMKKNHNKLVFKPNEKHPNYDKKNQREFLALPEHIQKEILYRIDILKIFNEEANYVKNIKEYVKHKGIGYATLYRWKKKYYHNGWMGLIPAHEKKGRKKTLRLDVENLIQGVIKERYLSNIQPSIKGCYSFLLIECNRRNLTPPSYMTFYRRVKEISNAECILGRRGKKVLRDKFKSLDGDYPFGLYPLDIIEFDHTILDIMLVDRIERKPIGRPTLTLAIDVYSRMIYGYYLSYDPPSYLTTGMCFLTGILPKEKTTKRFDTIYKWPIFGLPKSVLLDNAKEFRSGGLFSFCKLYNIQMRFNPIHRPDLKPYVERIFKTINEAIRDDLIDGYILPLDERKKTQYNPENKAMMTIQEFEKWLVNWIVDDYHQRIHNGIKEKENIEINPYFRFENGLSESNGKTVGLPTIPTNLEQLKFDILPFEKRVLSRNGIRLFGLEYNAPIIAKLRINQKNQKIKHIIKYDPRDIREVYLWSEWKRQYYNIPIKKVYYSQLMINPEDENDIPLGLKELEKIKKINSKKSPIKEYNLIKSMEQRQKLINESKKKTKTAKKSRKIEEVRNVYKTKATSTQIRKNKKKHIKDTSNEYENECKEFNLDWLKKNTFPSRSRWKEDEF